MIGNVQLLLIMLIPVNRLSDLVSFDNVELIAISRATPLAFLDLLSFLVELVFFLKVQDLFVHDSEVFHGEAVQLLYKVSFLRKKIFLQENSTQVVNNLEKVLVRFGDLSFTLRFADRLLQD